MIRAGGEGDIEDKRGPNSQGEVSKKAAGGT